jgi:hypothetical protein
MNYVIRTVVNFKIRKTEFLKISKTLIWKEYYSSGVIGIVRKFSNNKVRCSNFGSVLQFFLSIWTQFSKPKSQFMSLGL